MQRGWIAGCITRSPLLTPLSAIRRACGERGTDVCNNIMAIGRRETKLSGKRKEKEKRAQIKIR
jgi:hypothetical protein